MALNALAISALVMAVQSPLALWDVGFQLSLIVMANPLISAYQQELVPPRAERGAAHNGC